MYQLEDKTYFIYFIAIAILLVAFVLVLFWKRKKQKAFADSNLLEKLSPEISPF
jgi:Ca-activated chloride channel family protein